MRNAFVGLGVLGVYEEMEQKPPITTVRRKQRQNEFERRSRRAHSDANKRKHKHVLIAAHRLVIVGIVLRCVRYYATTRCIRETLSFRDCNTDTAVYMFERSSTTAVTWQRIPLDAFRNMHTVPETEGKFLEKNQNQNIRARTIAFDARNHFPYVSAITCTFRFN